MRSALVIASVLVATTPAFADEAKDDQYSGATVIFARGSALIRVDPRGRGETEVAKLAAKVSVRALRTDARGRVLLADLGGKWSWMKLDGAQTTLTDLPCADGPAQLAVDGACVLCRSTTSPTGSVIVTLHTGKTTAVEIPSPGARLIGQGAQRRLVWADAAGVWSAPPLDTKKKQRLAPEAPLRSFLPSPDGSRAVGVYRDILHEGKQTKPADLLMTFQLDGQAARRKAIKAGVPIEWSHDNQWVLLQDSSKACIMGAAGGEYKCWKGFTGASIASDGRWALVLGSRTSAEPDKQSKQSKKSKQSKQSKKSKTPEPMNEDENPGTEVTATDDVEVPPPSGPLALYRAELAGPYSKAPVRIVSIVDGAAVWIPGALR